MRVTRSPRGIVVGGASDGRGAWLCRAPVGGGIDRTCLETAVAKRAFARAWRGPVSAAEQATIRRLLDAEGGAGAAEAAAGSVEDPRG